MQILKLPHADINFFQATYLPLIFLFHTHVKIVKKYALSGDYINFGGDNIIFGGDNIISGRVKYYLADEY